VEFGLIREADGLKTFGAGILSSYAETPFSIDNASPNRIGFELERVMRTAYRIDDFQQTYFVLESFAQLFQALQQDLRPVHDRVKAAQEFAPDAVLPTDRIFTRGTGAWARRT
jgi:phenylalanine-4-hydroxylase